MAGRNRLMAIRGNEGEVIYSGRYAVVAEDKRFGLVARPREDPKLGKKEYLLNMIDELLVVYDGTLKRYMRDEISVSAAVKRSNIWHIVVMDKDGDVWFMPLVIDYVRFVRTADKVWMEDVDVDARARVGHYAVVLEDKDDVFHVFGRKDVRMKADELMLAVIEEALNIYEDLEKSRNINIMAVRGLVFRNGVAYYPEIRSGSALWYDVFGLPNMHSWAIVGFVSMDDDYEYFVRTAEEVVFIPAI